MSDEPKEMRKAVHGGATCSTREAHIQYLEDCLVALAKQTSGNILQRVGYPKEAYLNAAIENRDEDIDTLWGLLQEAQSKLGHARIAVVYKTEDAWACRVCEKTILDGMDLEHSPKWHDKMCPFYE